MTTDSRYGSPICGAAEPSSEVAMIPASPALSAVAMNRPMRSRLAWMPERTAAS